MREIGKWTETPPAGVRGRRYNDGRIAQPVAQSKRSKRTKERRGGLDTIKSVLTNPIYVGQLPVNIGSKAEPEWRTVDGKREPIIDPETWQDRLAEHRLRPRAQPGKFLLTGLLRSRACGGGMAGEAGQARC